MKKFISFLTAAAMCTSTIAFTDITDTASTAFADEWYFAGETCEPLHDTSRDIQAEGVGNPLNFGERNTPADASAAEIRAINHKMTVQEVKYALYKEIDEHWDLISTRLGQPDREKMYALFLGLGSRESTLGEGKIGSDHETAYADGWGVNSAHAYGTLQTAVTAFAGCDPTFMPEDNVPEMFQYDFTESNFYDCIISNHMGIRKILHFAEICINEEGMHGYQVIRNSLKGFNTGWCYMAEDDGAYKTYADEICSMAQFYYNEGHLYDNVFTWTSAGGEMEKYRTANRWDWWGDTEPSMAPIEEKPQTETTTTTTATTTKETEITTTTSSSTSSTNTTTVTSVTTTRTTIESYVLTDHYGTGNPQITTETYVVYITDPDPNTTTTTTTTSHFVTKQIEVNVVDENDNKVQFDELIADYTSVIPASSTEGKDIVEKDERHIFKNPEIIVYLHERNETISLSNFRIKLTPDSDKFITIPDSDVKIKYQDDNSDDYSFDYYTITFKGSISPSYGDANCDGEVSLADAVLIMQSLANPSKYGTEGSDKNKITEKGRKNADCSNVGDGMTNKDALAIQKYMLKIISALPETTE